jgi:hypothetical protein
VEALQAEEAKKTTDEAEIAQSKTPEPRPELTPEDLGFRLTATIVGSRVRMATINGKPYREKSAIAVPSSEDAELEPDASLNKPAFTLQAVNRKYVVLERNGRLYQLKLAR